MCFYSKQSKTAIELENRFKVKLNSNFILEPKEYIKGFDFPITAVISDENINEISGYKWGLIPSWAKDKSIQQYTLNAKIETIATKPSYKGSINKRCLVISNGFYEWKWLDEKGKLKQRYLIQTKENEIFTFAGIWSDWVDNQTGEIIKSYSIITTNANELMSEIHNSKKRMPLILTKENELEWLNGININEFKEVNIDLVANPF